MSDKIRLGIIGCGNICHSRHIPGLSLLKEVGLDDFEVTACCDPVEENAESAAEYLRKSQFANPQVFTDWREMISTAPLDAVDLPLPHHLHHIVGVACLEAGLHVIVEKPLAITVKLAKQLVEAAERSGKVLATALPMRRIPGQRAVHWAINEAKLIGEPRFFLANYFQGRKSPLRPLATGGLGWLVGSAYKEWRSAPQPHPGAVPKYNRFVEGGGSVLSSGPHFLDTIQYFYGPVEQVYARLYAFGPNSAILRGQDLKSTRENSVNVTFTFQSGLVGYWAFSTQLPGHRFRKCVTYGSEGSIEDTGYSNNLVVFHQFMSEGELRRADGSYLSMAELQAQMRQSIGHDRMHQYFPHGVTDPFALELWDFLKAIETGRSPEVDGWSGLSTVTLTEAIYESAFTDMAVSVAEVLDGEVSAWQLEIDEYWDNVTG